MESKPNTTKTKLKAIVIIAILFLILILLSSCSFKKVAFQSGKNFTSEDLSKVQFYTSCEIILTHVNQNGSLSVSNGKMTILNKKDIEQIVIPKNTKCVLERIVGENRMLFSFEQGDGKVLLFGNNQGGLFTLMAENWNGRTGTLPYADKIYTTPNGDVFLKIKIRKMKQLNGKSRIVSGKKI